MANDNPQEKANSLGNIKNQLKSPSKEKLEDYLKGYEKGLKEKIQEKESESEKSKTLLEHRKYFSDHAKNAVGVYESVVEVGGQLAKTADNAAAEVDSYVAKSADIAKALAQVKTVFQTLKDKLAKADDSAAALHDFVRRQQNVDEAVQKLKAKLEDNEKFVKIRDFGKKIEKIADEMNDALLSIPPSGQSIEVLDALKKESQKLKAEATTFSKDTIGDFDFSKDQLKKSHADYVTAKSGDSDAKYKLRIVKNEHSSLEYEKQNT